MIFFHNKETWIVAYFEYDVLWRRVTEVKKEKLIEYVYSWDNIITEYITQNNTTLHNEYVYNGTDNVLVSYRQEVDETLKGKYDFCNTTVLANRELFTKYYFSKVVTLCEDYIASKAIITKPYYYHKDHLGSTVAITDNMLSIVIVRTCKNIKIKYNIRKYLYFKR